MRVCECVCLCTLSQISMEVANLNCVQLFCMGAPAEEQQSTPGTPPEVTQQTTTPSGSSTGIIMLYSYRTVANSSEKYTKFILMKERVRM